MVLYNNCVQSRVCMNFLKCLYVTTVPMRRSWKYIGHEVYWPESQSVINIVVGTGLQLTWKSIFYSLLFVPRCWLCSKVWFDFYVKPSLFFYGEVNWSNKESCQSKIPELLSHISLSLFYICFERELGMRHGGMS